MIKMEEKMITSLYQSLCNMETNIADRVALRWYDEEKQGVAEVHYAQYAQDLRRFVAFLRAEYGDVRGKRVAILARNSYQYVICMYGTVIAGAVAVPLNLGKDWDAISYELGLTAAFPINPLPLPFEQVRVSCRENLSAAVENLVRFYWSAAR